MKFLKYLPLVLASLHLFGQSSSDVYNHSSVAEFIRVYGAQQRMIDSFGPYSLDIKSKFPKLPNDAISVIRDSASSQFFCGLIAVPFMETFSPDELQELTEHFKSTGCQKVFNSHEDVQLTAKEKTDVQKFIKSDVGVKFQKEWPTIKERLQKIAKFWSIDILVQLAKKYPEAFKE